MRSVGQPIAGSTPGWSDPSRMNVKWLTMMVIATEYTNSDTEESIPDRTKYSNLSVSFCKEFYLHDMRCTLRLQSRCIAIICPTCASTSRIDSENNHAIHYLRESHLYL